MSSEFIEISCVILANSHNPTIINHDWLIKHDFIPSDLVLEVEPIITPPYTRLQYQNGFLITLEQNKLVVSLFKNIEAECKILPAFIKKYMELLSHIPYIALGNNFKYITDDTDPFKWIESKLRLDQIPKTSGRLTASNFSLTYDLDNNRKKNINFLPLEQNLDNKKVTFLQTNANYHTDLSPETVTNETSLIVTNFDKDLEDFRKLVGML